MRPSAPRRSFCTRENAIRTNACPRRRPQRRRAVSLLAAAAAGISFGPFGGVALAADEPSELPRISVESGRIQVRRSGPAAPEVSTYVQGPGGPLSAPSLPGRRTLVETTLLGQDYEWAGGIKPRLRLGYGIGDGAGPASAYSDVYIRGVLIKEFR